MAAKRYAGDYETIITTDENGREKKSVVYRGDYFECTLDPTGLRRFRISSALLWAVILAFHLGAGFVNNPGMGRFYTALPYVFAYLPLFYIAAGILRLPHEKHPYRRDEIGPSFERMKTNSKFLLILLGAGMLGEIVFIGFIAAQGPHLLEYSYLALEALTFAVTYVFILLQRQVTVQPCQES